jgi:predicted secreted Zn-dependent protease
LLILKSCRDINVSAMEIRSACPKCGKTGTQNINYKPSKANPQRAYLRFYHGRDQSCHIGRVRTTGEVMGELNRPETKKEYERTLNELTADIRHLINNYSNAKHNSVRKISKLLKAILSKHGY